MLKMINTRLGSLRANFFWGYMDGIKKIPWIAWNPVLASKLKGGLGIGSLKALNISLLQNWRWRLFNSLQVTCVKVVSEIHGSYGMQTKIALSEIGGKMVEFGVGRVILMEELPVLNWIYRTHARWNLSMKGFEVHSLLYPLCNISRETTSHLFWSCTLATSVWRLVLKWINLPLPYSNNQNDVFNWLDHARLNSASKITLHSIFGGEVWMLW
ncbi:hypothetical protein Tco_0832517 [Tanacetum coccineum]